MPLYLFSNPSNENDVVEIAMSVHDDHEYIKDGVKWNRIFTSPQASADTKWDCNSAQDFVERSAKKKGKIGDLMDKSAELSQQRAEKLGSDPLKQKYYKKYKEIRGGKEHPDIVRQKTKNKLDKLGFEIG